MNVSRFMQVNRQLQFNLGVVATADKSPGIGSHCRALEVNKFGTCLIDGRSRGSIQLNRQTWPIFKKAEKMQH